MRVKAVVHAPTRPMFAHTWHAYSVNKNKSHMKAPGLYLLK